MHTINVLISLNGRSSSPIRSVECLGGFLTEFINICEKITTPTHLLTTLRNLHGAGCEFCNNGRSCDFALSSLLAKNPAVE